MSPMIPSSDLYCSIYFYPYSYWLYPKTVSFLRTRTWQVTAVSTGLSLVPVCAQQTCNNPLISHPLLSVLHSFNAYL